MANKQYSTYTFSENITEQAQTYYDLPFSQQETVSHKHYIIGSATTDGQYTDSAKYVDLTLVGVPNIMDANKFTFYEDRCKILRFDGCTEDDVLENGRAYLNADDHVMQGFGILDNNGYVDYHVAFVAKRTLEGGSRSYTRMTWIGAFDGDEQYSYDEATRTLSLEYVGVKYSPAAYIDMAPFEVQFAGVETWTKKYTNTYSYSLSADSTPTLHLGKAIVKSELNNLFIKYNVSATKPTRNDQNWPDGTASSSENNFFKTVEISDLVSSIPYGNEYALQVKTNFKDSDNFNVVLGYSCSVIGLSNTPFANFVPPVTAYQIGDTIDLDSILDAIFESDSALLTYTDNTKISLHDFKCAAKTSSSISMSVKIGGTTRTDLRTLTIQNLTNYSDCSITISIPLLNENGVVTTTLTYTYSVEIAEVLAFAVRINDPKTDFVYGDTATYGADVTATLFDNAGNEIDTKPIATFLANGTLISDTKIASNSLMTNITPVTLEGKTGQAVFKTTLQNANYYQYLAFVSYCDSFQISETNLGDVYVNYNEETSIATLLSGITATYVYHHNTSAGSETTSVAVANEDLTKSTETLTALSDINNFEIAFSCTPEESPNQTLSAKASLNIKINKFVSLEVTHAATGNTYYAGRTNTFVLPSDLVVKKVYNNPTLAAVELTEEEIINLEYRTSEGTNGTALEPTESTIPSSTKTIYVTLTLENGTVLQGSYSIAGDYQSDIVTALNVGASFTFIKGNKLSTYKNNGTLKLIAHYASGYVTNTTTDVFTDYRIVQKVGDNYVDNEKVVMNSGETIYVKHNGNYYQVGFEEDVSITYANPTGRISISGYPQTFVNLVDKIDFRNIQAEITYDNTHSDTTVVASLDSGNTATASTYALTCEGITAFDGSETFDIQDAGITFTKTFTISAVSRFDANSSITATFTVQVASVASLTVIRLVVRNAKKEYKVGETFLGADDNAVIDLYHTSSVEPLTLSLKDVPSIIATEPAQGTTFTRTNDAMNVTVRLLSDATKYTTYTAKVVPINATTKTITHNICAVLIPNGTTTGVEELNKSHYYHDKNGNTVAQGYYILVNSSLTEIDANGARVLRAGTNLTEQKVYGYLEDIFNTNKSARVILFDDYVPPNQGESNIEVRFPCYVEGNADKIDKCHIAKLFGNSNAKNRLFLAGNPSFGNCDWHSSAINSYLQQGEVGDANGDFTYFGDMDYCFYGQTDNAIMGYDNVATDKMVVLKSKSKVEPTNYFRTSSLIQAIDAGGNVVNSVDGSTLYQESFPLATGNIGSGAMNYNSIVNLNGDTLYISSENTICGLDISGQVGDSQRISYSRSRYIDPELKELDLSEAVLWTDNASLYLFTGEAAYMTHYESFNTETAQYEWWKIDVKGARCAIDIDGETFFGSENGSLYKFDKSVHYDCDKIFFEAGGTLYVSLNTLFGDNKIVYAQDVNPEIDEDAEYTFSMKPATLSKSLFRRVASIRNTEEANIDLVIDYDDNALKIVALDESGKYDANRHQVLVEELSCGCKFYLNYADGKSAIEAMAGSPLLDYYRAYTLVPTDDFDDTYKLYDADGNEVALSRQVTSNGITSRVSVLNSANLCRVLDGIYEVFDIDKTDCSFKLKENGRELDVIRYGDQGLAAQSFISELHKHTPVYSYFIAAPAVLGDLSYRKTIWAWTLSAFKEANDLQVCVATNEENLEKMKVLAFADSVPIGTDLKKLSILQMDFEKSVVPRKYTYFRPISVPFISFGFKSDKAVNSILTATSIVYTIPMIGRGNK